MIFLISNTNIYLIMTSLISNNPHIEGIYDKYNFDHTLNLVDNLKQRNKEIKNSLKKVLPKEITNLIVKYSELNLYVIQITGDRNWDDQYMIDETLSEYQNKDVILIHGDCVGADKMSGISAKKYKHWNVISEPANWKKYGRAAGPIRNKEMIVLTTKFKELGFENIVLAFHDCLDISKGTKNCVDTAIKFGLLVWNISH